MESFIYLFAWINLKTGFHLECFFLNLKCIHSIETPKILKQIFKMPSCVNVIFF